MKIDKLPKTEITVEKASAESPDDEKQLSPEEIEQREKFFRSEFIRANIFTLRQINDRLKYTGLTLENLRQEVIDKKSPLSKTQRDLLIVYKLDFIQQLINDMNEARERAIKNRYAVQS